MLPRDAGSPRHSCNKNQIKETELRSCGVSSFKVAGAAVPAEPRSSSSSRTPPPEPLHRPGWRTRPCKTSSGSQFPFDLSPRTSLIWDSRTVTDSTDMRPLAFRQKRSLRPLRGWKDSLVGERDHLTGSVVYYRMDGWQKDAARVSCLPNYQIHAAGGPQTVSFWKITVSLLRL